MKLKMLFRVTLLICLVLTSNPLLSQQLDMNKLKGIDVRSIGPAGMSGRITAIDVVTEKPNTIYIGSASGGVWKSESGGIDWKPIFDDQKSMSIGAIAIQQSNPDVIWVGTGEGNPRNSLNGGYGIYRSLDAGKSWQLMGLEKTRNIHRIIVDPSDPNTIYVAAIGSPWGEHPERGVFKTIDGGNTWEKVLFVNNKTGAAEMVMDPSNPNKLIVSMWQHRRYPWFFESGGASSGLYMTIDGGVSWKTLNKDEESGLPKGDLGRIGIAIAPSDPNRVYALVESKKNALYRSDDGGYKWKQVNSEGNEIGNRPFYYSEIYVDPSNENRLYTVFTYINVSEDGGKSFKELMPAYGTSEGVHPDHHAWWIHPTNSDFMIDGNDGGLNITHDRGKSWRFVENLPVGQFYHINVDNEYPYNVYGGMQDNGSWAGPAYAWKAQGIRNSYWQEIAFGDGFDVIPDLEDSRYGFAQSQQGFVIRYDRVTGHQRIVRPTHPDAEMRLRFNWNAAIAADPFDNKTYYFGSQFVHKTTDKGASWQILSADLTTNNPEKQRQEESGGLTTDATGAENNTTIVTIAPSPLEKEVIWVGTDDGIIQITKDGGKSWNNVSTNIKDFPKDSWVAQITASSHRKGEAFAIVNNYRNFDFQPYLYHTADYGKTWKNIVNAEQVWTYTLAFVQDPVEPNLMFLGSDGGLYVSIDAGKNWTQWTNKYPKVSTRDLVIHPREHDLIIGTFGRAIYVMDDIRPLREIAKNGPQLLAQKIKLFNPPATYQVISHQPNGTRFSANAIFNGENRSDKAMISYLVNVPEKKEEKKQDEEEGEQEPTKEIKYDSLTFQVYSGHILLRTIKMKTPEKSGIHRMYWNMDEAGVRGPSRRMVKADAPEVGGINVLPGTYKIKMQFGEYSDSSAIEVKYDPRVQMDPSILVAQYAFKKTLEKESALAGKATIRIVEAQEIIDFYIKQMKEKSKESFKAQIKESKALKDSLEVLLVPFVGKDNSKKQGIIRSPKPDIGDRIGNASYYAASSMEIPGSTEKRLQEQASQTLSSQIQLVNRFFQEQWPLYQAKMEAIDISPFKELIPLIKE
jgi:photosystem II stability/assembly factor-like uncharacterized protein